MLASPRFSGRQGFPVAKTSGFTLIELLTVVAIIMIVAGIAIGVQRGVYASQANGKARGEIQALATALERYKAAYGTYPVVNNNAAEFYRHLTGQVYSHFTKASGGAAKGSWSTSTGTGQSFIDIAQMTTNGTAAVSPTEFRDPWGEAYVYVYSYDPDETDSAKKWDRNYFILYSKGPNKKARTESNSLLTHSSSARYFGSATEKHDSQDDIVFGLEQ